MNLSSFAGFTRAVAFGGMCVSLLCLDTLAVADERPRMLACAADVRTLCPGMRPGDRRIATCLSENEAKLSPACQAQLGKVAACKSEVKKLCLDAQDESELRECAKAKRAELSIGCRAAAGG